MAELSEEQKQEIAKLYDHGEGLPIYKISKQMNMPYSRIYTYLRLKERGFDSVTDYLKFRAKERGYKTLHEYDKVRLMENYEQTVQQRKNYLAQQLGFKSRNERRKIRGLEKRLGLEESARLSLGEKRKMLARKKVKSK